MTQETGYDPMNCPGIDELRRFRFEQMPEIEEARISAHLENCERCEDSVNLMELQPKDNNEEKIFLEIFKKITSDTAKD